jgi:hypothetical protein
LNIVWQYLAIIGGQQIKRYPIEETLQPNPCAKIMARSTLALKCTLLRSANDTEISFTSAHQQEFSLGQFPDSIVQRRTMRRSPPVMLRTPNVPSSICSAGA